MNRIFIFMVARVDENWDRLVMKNKLKNVVFFNKYSFSFLRMYSIHTQRRNAEENTVIHG